MSKSDVLEAAYLKLVFNGTAIANIADNTATSPLTNIFVALHTADPGETGTQSTSEATYTGYARVSVARTTGGWTVSGTSPTVCSPVAAITFGACTAGTNTITHFSVGSLTSGAGVIYYSGTVTPSISVSSGVTPQLTTASTISED